MTIPVATIIQASKCASMLAVLQNDLILLESGGFRMEKDLKYKANNFKDVLDKSLQRFFQNMPEDAQMQYFKLANKIEGAINQIMLEEFKGEYQIQYLKQG